MFSVYCLLIYLGTPNVPRITRISFNEQSKGDISVTWKIETHELRPVDRYILMYSIRETKTGVSKPEQSDSGEIDSRMLGREQFNVTVHKEEVNCKLNATGNHCKHIVKLEEDFKTDTTHNAIVKVCAENEFGRACGDPQSAILMPASLSGQDPQQPRDVIIGVVVVLVVFVLLCCLLWTIVAVICGLCGVGELEKKYRPERRGLYIASYRWSLLHSMRWNEGVWQCADQRVCSIMCVVLLTMVLYNISLFNIE